MWFPDLSGRRLGLQCAGRSPAECPGAAGHGPPPWGNTFDLRFQRETQDRPYHHDQPEHEDAVQSRRDRDGAEQVGGDQDFQPEQQGSAEGLAQLKSQAISIYRKLGTCSRSQAVARSRELGLMDV